MNDVLHWIPTHSQTPAPGQAVMFTGKNGEQLAGSYDVHVSKPDGLTEKRVGRFRFEDGMWCPFTPSMWRPLA